MGAARVKGLKMRDARRDDKGRVFEFTRRTWGQYGDFIPRVWHRWIGDKRGRLIIAELRGVPVGLAKITDFGRGEIWLEGLRVDPEQRGKGIARAINIEVLRTLREMKPKAVRYCTGRSNWASRHIGEKFGFTIAARLRYYWQKSRKGRMRGHFARRSDAGAIYDFMWHSKYLDLSRGLIAEGWIFRELTPGLLEAYIRQERVVVLRESGKITGVAVYPLEKADQALTLGFVDGDPASIKALARNCLYLARVRGDDSCSIAVPSRRFARIVEDAGFKRKDSMGQVVLEFADPGGLARRTRPA